MELEVDADMVEEKLEEEAEEEEKEDEENSSDKIYQPSPVGKNMTWMASYHITLNIFGHKVKGGLPLVRLCIIYLDLASSTRILGAYEDLGYP